MKIPLSNRLRACCDLIRPDDVVADIGCDHGYLGIHLLTSGGARRVLAGDVNPQPLESAIANAEKFGVRDKMRFYLSDGLKNIPRDLTVAVLAGMGADTMIAILDAAPWIRDGKYRLVLQCQSHRPQLRRYLYEQGFQIRRESTGIILRSILRQHISSCVIHNQIPPGSHIISRQATAIAIVGPAFLTENDTNISLLKKIISGNIRICSDIPDMLNRDNRILFQNQPLSARSDMAFIVSLTAQFAPQFCFQPGRGRIDKLNQCSIHLRIFFIRRDAQIAFEPFECGQGIVTQCLGCSHNAHSF